MKRIMLLSFFLVALACDDGDLQIETLDFDSIDPQSCETIEIGGPDEIVLFKIDGDQALILELPSTAIQNVVASNVESEVTAGGSTAITYRIFDDIVTSDYFCSQVPLGSPLVEEEIQAEGGQVFITTSTLDSITYTHTIELSGISLVTSTNTRITDLSINEFGVVTTTQDVE